MTVSLPTEEQQALADGVAEFLAAQFPLARFRTRQAADCGKWRDLAAMGVFGVSLPVGDGGMGLSWVDEVRICREAGRSLVSPAWIGTVLAARVAAHAGLSTLCAALLAGERHAGVAMVQASSELTPLAAELRVFDADGDLFALVAPQRVRLVECAGTTLRALDCIDETVQLCAAKQPVAELASTTGDEFALAAQLLAAAMLCGVLERTRDMAAEHARTRVQFGRPIGAFQAIKHRCADIALGAELCWSQTLQAAHALAEGAADAQFHVLAAKWLAGEESLKATRFNIQAHGAMGFTDEVDAHRLLKRVHVLHQLFADPRGIPATLLDLELEL